MKVAEWLFESMKKLGDAEVDSPRRDALVLLEDTLKKDRSWVLSHPEYELNNLQLKAVNKLIARRVKREPLAYIRGKAWFYGRFFEVNENALIPRPESEDFIDLLKKINPKIVVDIGTGSGALAVTAKLELPKAHVYAIDIDKNALSIAKSNAKKHKVKINFIRGSLLLPIIEISIHNYVVIANLPYVPENFAISPEVKKEPKIALFSGLDGLEHYKNFWQQITKLNSKPEYILCESLEPQHSALNKMALTSGFALTSTTRLIQTFKKN